MSPPSRGAWIEIWYMVLGFWSVSGRPPRRGRGLKSLLRFLLIILLVSPPSRGAWIEIYKSPHNHPNTNVAPLAGGVG